MGKLRALYICPATKAAIVAVAPVLTIGRDYEVVKTLLLRGIADPMAPTADEQVDAIWPATAITAFLASRNIAVVQVDAPPYDPDAWRDKIGDALTLELLADIDLILFNGQAGTKQMSFGIWDGLTDTIRPHPARNLEVRRCYVNSDTAVKVQIGRTHSAIDDISIADILTIYGFEEVERARREAGEAWILRHSDQLVELWRAKLVAPNEPRAAGIAAQLTRAHPPGPWSVVGLASGGWLEAGIYLQALRRKQTRPNGNFVACSTKIWHWASCEPAQRDARRTAEKHYEIDIAIATNGVLHLIECKDSMNALPQEAIHKQAVLRQRLQGRGGVNAIVARNPPEANSVLAQKAQSNNIGLYLPARAPMTDCFTRIFGPDPAG